MKTKIKKSIFFLLSVALVVGTVFVLTPGESDAVVYETSPIVKRFHIKTKEFINEFFAYDAGFKGGVSVGSADINGDGVDEIVTGAGPGGGPHIRIFDKNGNSRGSFFAFGGDHPNGVNVAGADVNGDGRDEIVVGKMYGGDCKTEIWWRSGGSWKKKTSFAPFEYNFKYGMNVAGGDVNGDGRDEVVVASNIKGRIHFMVLDGMGRKKTEDWVFENDRMGGTSIDVGDVDGDGRDEVVVAERTHGENENWGVVRVVKRVRGGWQMIHEFLPYGEPYRGGLSVAVGDINNDGRDEIATGVHNSDNRAEVKVFNKYGLNLDKNTFIMGDDVKSGINIAIGRFTGATPKEQLVASPSVYDDLMSTADPNWHRGGQRKIVIDLSDQRLYAYEGDHEVNSFLVSTGLPQFPTPTGNFVVGNKIYSMLYEGYYGPGSPHNYYLPNTLYNLSLAGTPYLIHGAYWHNNFGHVMSHGCINLSYPDAGWMWAWGQTGDPVEIRP